MIVVNEGLPGQEGYIHNTTQCPEVLQAKARAEAHIGQFKKHIKVFGKRIYESIVEQSDLAAPVAPGPWSSSQFVYHTRRMRDLTGNDGYCWRYAASQTFGLPFALFNQLTHSMINSDKKNMAGSPKYDSQITGLKSMWENMNKP